LRILLQLRLENIHFLILVDYLRFI